MMNTEDDVPEDYCFECSERDVLEALVPVVVATKLWPYTERLVHPECRDRFVAANLTAVLTSLRGVTL